MDHSEGLLRMTNDEIFVLIWAFSLVVSLKCSFVCCEFLGKILKQTFYPAWDLGHPSTRAGSPGRGGHGGPTARARPLAAGCDVHASGRSAAAARSGRRLGFGEIEFPSRRGGGDVVVVLLLFVTFRRRKILF